MEFDCHDLKSTVCLSSSHLTPSYHVNYQRMTFFFPLCELSQFKCVKTLEPLEWEHEMSLMAGRGPVCLCSPTGAGYCGSALLIWEVIFAQGTPPPLGWQKKFLKGCCYYPQVDNNNSESKCKLRGGEILSALLQV